MKKHFTQIFWGGVSLILALSAATACQQHLNFPAADSEPVDEIIFRASDLSLEAEVSTKATAVTSLTSFYVSAVTGAAGSETAVWTNVSFSGNNDDGFKAAAPGKWWPAADASYRFYAANSALTFAASGATVAATNATDIVCAYMASPSYKANNTLSFEHIFARLGQVTVSAASGYTISNVSIKVTPKTGGTYNLLTGAGQTDGTGWSGLATGSETVIGNAVGNTANDIYLVPGTYTLTASWTATKGDYTENIENMTCDVNLVAGKINKISTTLSGNAKEIVFNINIAPWTEQSAVVEFPTKKYTFGGLMIAPGNLYYDGSSWSIDPAWNTHCTYNTAYGVTGGTASSYFNFLDMGTLFEKAGFSHSDGDITNELDPLDGWRLPTRAEWCTITTGTSPGTSRTGATVNGVSGKKYALVQLKNSEVTYATSSTLVGLLLFPDKYNLTIKVNGSDIVNMNNNTCNNDMTLTELNSALSQGCAFLPTSGGTFGARWEFGDSKGLYQSSTEYNFDFEYNLFLDSSTVAPSGFMSKGVYYVPVRLVRES